MQIEFFYDPASPYTYLAATQIEGIAERNLASVVYRPMLLGKVFEATGNRMPASVPAKGKYMMGDLQRWAIFYGVDFAFPKVFPINSKLPQRVACLIPDDRAGEWARTIMRTYWADGIDIGAPEGVRAAAQAMGLDADALIAQADSDTARDALRGHTDEAIARGAFGAPTFFVGDAMFWGCDRLTLLEHHLAGQRAA